MISGIPKFFTLMDLYTCFSWPKFFKSYRKKNGTIPYLNFLEIQNIVNFGKTGTETSKKSFNVMLQILNMRSTSIKKHEWIFAHMLPISITEHNMIFWWHPKFLNFGHHRNLPPQKMFVFLILGFPPKQSSSPSVFNGGFQNTFCNISFLRSFLRNPET